MDPTAPFDWSRMFFGVEPIEFFLEILVRIVLVYSFTIIVVRWMGKRGRRQLSTFELVLVIALGSATGDSLIYPEVPILYAWIVVVVMVALNRLLEWVQVRSHAASGFLEGKPRLLMVKGEVDERGLRAEGLERDEFFGMLREHDISNIGEVEYAFLEVSGNLGIIQRRELPTPELESMIPAVDRISDHRGDLL